MALTLTYIGSNNSGANLAVYDFGDFNAPGAGLMIVVSAANSAAATTHTSVSIGGASGASITSTGPNMVDAAIYTRLVSAGNQNVTVTFSATKARAGVSVYLLTGYQSATPHDADFSIGTAINTGAMTLDYPTGGVGLYGVYKVGGAVNITWSAASEDADQNIELTGGHLAAAHKTATGAGNTETATFATSVPFGAVFASWEELTAGGAPATRQCLTGAGI